MLPKLVKDFKPVSKQNYSKIWLNLIKNKANKQTNKKNPPQPFAIDMDLRQKKKIRGNTEKRYDDQCVAIYRLGRNDAVDSRAFSVQNSNV